MKEYVIICLQRDLVKQLMVTIDTIIKNLDPDKVSPVHYANLRILGNELQKAYDKK